MHAKRTINRLTVVDLKNMTVGETKYDGDLDITRTRETAWQATYRFMSPVTGKRRSPSKTWDRPALKAMREWRDPLLKKVGDGIDPLVEAEQNAAAQRAALQASTAD